MAFRIEVQNMLVAGHPVTGAYSVDDQTAHAEMTAFNIEGDASPESIYNYLIGTPFRGRPLWGAVYLVASSKVGDTVDFQASGPDITLTGDHICAARALVDLATRETVTQNLRSTYVQNQILTPLGHTGSGCDCMDATTDIAALQALSDGVHSDATLNNVPNVKIVDITH